MALFRKKNNFTMRFDLASLEYHYVSLNNGVFEDIPFSSLDRVSKKKLLNANRELLTNGKLLKREILSAKASERFKFLQSIGFPCTSFEYLGEDNGVIAQDVDNYLDDILNEENVLIGIHRTSLSFQEIEHIFSDGLSITGHLGGACSSPKQLSDNISYYPSNLTIKKELTHANAYKNSKGSILVRIPDEDLLKNIDILIESDNGIVLNPKYIVGYVPVKDNKIDKIIFNPSYLKKQDEVKKRM